MARSRTTISKEVERQSLRSCSNSLNSHERAAKHLQRQSTPNSSRRYYYGDSQHHQRQARKQVGKRPTSLSSSLSSLSSLETHHLKPGSRDQGAQSRDSGFKSPNSNRMDTQDKQIYSVSRKSNAPKRGSGAVSPTGSAGQRSVKTTTTTLSAGLADRPMSRNNNDKENRKSSSGQQTGARSRSRASDKVSKPASPFQRLSSFFGSTKSKQAAR